MATTGQISLIRTIMSEREMEGHHVEWVEERLDRADNELVQTILTRLKALPRKGQSPRGPWQQDPTPSNNWGKDVQPALVKAAPARERVSEIGFYLLDGKVLKIVQAKAGHFYAKETTAHGLQPVYGVMGRMFADMKMTGEQIAAHGVANHYCVNCSTELEDPKSQAIGLGTSCGPAILGESAYKAAVADFKAANPEYVAAEKARAKALREAKKAEQAQGVLV